MAVTAESVKARWGKTLKQQREAAGETQLQLANRLGRDPQTISRLERGEGAMDLYLEAAGALGVDLVGEAS